MADLELALRFQTYHIIVKNLYDNRNKIEFAGSAALTNYFDRIKLPPRVSVVQQNGSVVDLIANTSNNDNSDSRDKIVDDEEIIENSDMSVFIDDLDDVMDMFGSKK